MQLIGLGLKGLQQEMASLERRLGTIAYQATRCADASGELLAEELALQQRLAQVSALYQQTLAAKEVAIAA